MIDKAKVNALLIKFIDECELLDDKICALAMTYEHAGDAKVVETYEELKKRGYFLENETI